MANLNRIVYLSEDQKAYLFENNSITVDGVTLEYNDNDLYVTPSQLDNAPISGGGNPITSGGVYTAIQDFTIGPSGSVDNHIAVFNGTSGKSLKDSGFTIGTSVPANAVFTDTTYSAATISTAGLMTATDKIKLDGITADADAVSFTRSLASGTKIGTITINGTGTDLYCETNTNTTYEFVSGINGFTVTPSGGTAQTITVTPSITNNITGTGANGYLTKFDGTNTITNGPALGSNTTTFLRNDGAWATPPVTEVAGKTGAVGLESLTIGHSIYNGSTPVEVSIADLGLSSSITFLGVTTNNIQKPNNGVYDTTNPVTLISGNSVTAVDGNVVLVKSNGEEFLWTESHWEPLGLATSYALSSHLHGNITNQGAITKEGIELQSGDQLLFANYDNSGKIEKTAITFDGSTTNEFLSRKGTWQAAPDASTSQKGIVQLVDSVSSTATNMAATARAVNEAYQAIAGKVNKSGDIMTGPLTVKVLKGTNGIDYGGVLPATATEGQIFFQTSAPHYELPAGGATGAVLIKNSNDDRDVRWSLDNIPKSFTVTLSSGLWSNNIQTVSNANFLASGFGYIVAPASGSFIDYAAASIYADNVTTDGNMTFHCARLPVSNLTVNIMRMVSL